jgi:hypothetical protein
MRIILFRYIVTLTSLCYWIGPDCLAQEAASIPFWANQYQSVRSSAGLYIVASKEGKMGILDGKGKALTALEYDTIYNFREQMAIVGKGKRQVNQFGKILSDFKYGYINQQGKLTIPVKYERVNNFSEGLAHVTPSLREDIWFNKEGKVVISSPNFPYAEDFQGGLAYVEVGYLHQGFKLTNQYNPLDVRGNYIDHQGRLLVPWQYDSIAPFSAGFLRPVRKNGKWGFLDSAAKVVVNMHYDDVDQDSTSFWQDLRRVGVDKQYGFINQRTGQLVVPLRYEASKPSQSKYIWVREGGKWGCLTSNNKLIIGFTYDDVRPFEGGQSAIQQGNKWGLIDTTGKVITPPVYELILPFRENRALIKRANKFGFVNRNGQEVIAPIYTKASSFIDGQAYATYWGLFIQLGPDGHWLRFKLQPNTLKLIAGLLCVFLAAGFYWWKRRQVFQRKTS